MNWYYVDAGQQVGPVSEAKLEELVQSGKVLTHTLVWHEGMANWQPYGQLKNPGQPLAAAGDAPVRENSPPEAVCSQCKRSVKVEEMIRHGALYVCAECKPAFMQKLQEGVDIGSAYATTESFRYAGFWIRFAAFFVDNVIVTVTTAIPMIVVALMTDAFRRNGPDFDVEAVLGQLMFQLWYYVLGALYAIYFIGKHGATPGKMLCGLKVVMSDGRPISYGRATGRFFAQVLSSMICYIGFLIAGFDARKRALHDHICSTYVVYK